MFKIAVSFIVGLAAYKFLPFFPLSILSLSLLAVVILFFISVINPFSSATDLIKCKRESYGLKFLIIFIFLSAAGYSSVRIVDSPAILFPPQEVMIKGTVIDIQTALNGNERIILDLIKIDENSLEGRVRLSFPVHSSLENMVSGDRVSASARLKEPFSFHNPGVYSPDLKSQGIIGTGFTEYISITGRGGGLFAWADNKRQRLGRIIENSFSPESTSLIKAIIPGLKRGISHPMRDAFSSTGLAHLLSISGTHFGLLAFLFYSFFRMTLKYLPGNLLTRVTIYISPFQASIVLTLPVLFLYALMSGMSTPTIRSFIMVSIYMTALSLGRKGQWLNSLSIAALVILTWQPDALFTLSFQLSFIAVLSIGYLLEHRAKGAGTSGAQPGQPRVKVGSSIFDKLKTTLLLTMAAVLGTAPLMAMVFKQFPLISPIANLVVTPLVCLVILPLGFLTGFFALTFDLDIMPLNGLTEWVTHLALKLIQSIAAIPYASINLHNPTVMIVIFYYIALFILFKSKKRSRFLPLLFTLGLYTAVPYVSGDSLRVTFLDIGQGDAAVIEFPDQRVMLIDGGSGEPDMGRLVIAPFLRSRGIRKIDCLVLSHSHFDHYGGLINVIDHFAVDELWFNGRVIEGSEAFFRKIGEKNIRYRMLSRGDLIKGNNYKVTILHPYDEFYADSPRGNFSDENSDSLVLKIVTNNTSILFVGDLENEAEDNMIALGEWLRSDILKVPHHGGRTSSSRSFISAVNPGIAVISAGRNNRFNHPHKETIERYDSVGVKLYRTDHDGAVTIVSNDDKYNVYTYADSKLKKVENWQDELRNLRLLFSEF